MTIMLRLMLILAVVVHSCVPLAAMGGQVDQHNNPPQPSFFSQVTRSLVTTAAGCMAGIACYSLWNWISKPKQAPVYELPEQRGEPIEEHSSTARLTLDSLAGPLPQEILELRQLYKDPVRIQVLGINLHSILLVGAAGTGKTTLAHALAHEINGKVFSCSATQFAGSFYGDGARILRKTFDAARYYAQYHKTKAILIVDDLDLIKHLSEYKNTLNELVGQVHGLKNDSVIVIATIQNLEEGDAQLRKFDRVIEIGLPSTQQREALLCHFAQSLYCDKSLDFHSLAVSTKNFNCTDLKNVVNKAAMYAAQESSMVAHQTHFNAVIEKHFESKHKNQQEKMVYTQEESLFTFKNLAGKIPTQVLEITDFIKNSEKYAAMGARMPKGILLIGPPGTGKTSIARAIAGETGASFFTSSASEFVEKFVGVGPSRVRELFAKAREAVKTGPYKKAIIFIDEIDAIGGARVAAGDSGGSEYRGTLNELLNQMDGFAMNNTLFVIAATNRQQDIDTALKRPGRFDRIVEIGLPDAESREAILKLYTEKIKHSTDINFTLLAQKTQGMSGADLENFVNEAAITAVREKAPLTLHKHFMQSLNWKVVEKG